MNREDIERMARQAGMTACGQYAGEYRISTAQFSMHLERFAALVAAAEREACEKVCIDQTMIQPSDDYNGGCFACFDAIRKRGEK